MWALVTELLFSLVLLAFLVISCQNVLHIASGSVLSVLTFMHKQLDRELGEVEDVLDEEENVTTRVVRRRVILKVQRAFPLAACLVAFLLYQLNSNFCVSCNYVHGLIGATRCSGHCSSSSKYALIILQIKHTLDSMTILFFLSADSVTTLHARPDTPSVPYPSVRNICRCKNSCAVGT